LALVLHAVRDVRGTESFALGALTLGHTAELDFVTCDASFVCKGQHHPQHRTVGVVAANAAMTGGHGGRWWMAKRKGLSKLLCQRDGTTRSGKWRGGCARRWFVCHQHSRQIHLQGVMSTNRQLKAPGSPRSRNPHDDASTCRPFHGYFCRALSLARGAFAQGKARLGASRRSAARHLARPTRRPWLNLSCQGGLAMMCGLTNTAVGL